MKEIHLFILWENARNKEKEILNDIKENFNIIGMYNISWNKENFSNNLSRFYGTNLPENSGKEKHCGNGDFLLIIVEVENPKYEPRDTSKGVQIVNTNMFDKKAYYRELTGGGHKVHATNSEIETNHDLTLLLGKNIEDYLKDLDRTQKIKMVNLNKDLVGQNGFNTVKEMFYVLNNCINYAIIRNYEELPNEIYVNEHNDIDIICDSHENAAYILNAKKVFPEEYRVHYKVKVEDKFAYFDLRHIGDNYYCYEMEKQILKNRIYNVKGFFTISDEEYFYALIYHALLHKPKLMYDYIVRLQEMNKTNKKLENKEDFVKVLNDWLLQKKYSIKRPIDNSVQFNIENAKKFDKILLGEKILLKIRENQINEKERKIIKYINEHEKEEYDKFIKENKEVDTLISLSDISENIISWYPFKENCTILEIGADFGQITGVLCNKANRVVSLEYLQEKKNAISIRHKNRKNLNIINKLEEVNEKFDYITLIGIERITDFPEVLLKEIKKYLNEDGKILLATNNKIGMKYFSTMDENGEEVTNLIDKKLYTLDEILEQIENAGFENKKIYYPMTDYKLTNVIYTDEKPLSKNNLNRNIVYNKENNVKFYEQNLVYSKVLDTNNGYKVFSNSFFIEIFNGEYEENNIRLVAYSNMRKPEYRIKTVMKKDFVYKTALNEQAKSHIENIKENIDILNKLNLKTLDTYDKDTIISKFSKEKTLDKIILEKIKESKDDAIELIKKYKELLYENMIEGNKENNVFDKFDIKYSKEEFQDMKFTKYGLWDLTFQNCFYINDDFYFYDQEWKEENVPIDFILYRAIKYFSQILNYIDVNELYEVLKIKKEIIEKFEELDNKLQENIRDEVMWKLNTQGKSMIDLKRDKLTANHEINILKNENSTLMQENNILKGTNNKLMEENKKLNEQLQIILQSKSWKIMEPLRKIRKKLK